MKLPKFNFGDISACGFSFAKFGFSKIMFLVKSCNFYVKLLYLRRISRCWFGKSVVWQPLLCLFYAVQFPTGTIVLRMEQGFLKFQNGPSFSFIILHLINTKSGATRKLIQDWAYYLQCQSHTVWAHIWSICQLYDIRVVKHDYPSNLFAQVW